MNEKEILKRAVNKMEDTLVEKFLIGALTIVAGMTIAIFLGMILWKWRVISLLLVSVIGIGIGLAIWSTTKHVEAEAHSLWNKIYISLSRQEVTLDEILAVAKKEQASEDVIEFIGQKKRGHVADDLALQKLQEREAEHIPSI